MSDKLNKQKEELMKEVLRKKRTTYFENVDAVSYLNNKKTINEANSVLEELNSILSKQQKDLELMSAENSSEIDMNKLQKDIEKDFGVVIEPKNFTLNNVSKEKFIEIQNELKEFIIGQDEAVNNIIKAFRRPYVMNDRDNKSRNSIIVRGKVGLGKHTLVTKVASLLYKNNIILSDEVYTIDMSLYTSSSQEQLFLQDLYVAIKGKGVVICFENFEQGFAPFLRMINDLVVSGKMMLNKRYVINKGQLVEAQTGLVSDVVSSLSAEGKYLVFISNNKLSKIIDAFGTSFMDNIGDVVELDEIQDDILKEIVNIKLDELILKCKTNLKLNINKDEDLLNYIINTYNKDNGLDSIDEMILDLYKELSELKLKDFINDNIVANILIENNSVLLNVDNNKFSLTKSQKNDLDEINKELDEIIGLSEVKKYIKSLQSHILVQKMRKQQGLKSSDVSKHMIFKGNPGTGKTTIARLISRYMKAIGALSQGQLVEVTRSDLVGKYVGHTAPLTMQVIKSALGGVLFIDEAYSLYRGKDDSFGLEAIDTLVKAMEDYRDDLIVILAGYSHEMATFLESNSGLKSRFNNIIEFTDYTGNELYEIAISIAKSKGYTIDENAKDALVNFFIQKQETDAKSSGNGRLSRNVVEDAILKQAERVIKDNSAQIDILKLEDFDLN
ncbi:MAG: AAA family ATPase [Erysipelotrichaceae bacterium]|nr:AAA family ATPase [Erysipelotrichaceae bacterium]